jgi:hypothetical protein
LLAPRNVGTLAPATLVERAMHRTSHAMGTCRQRSIGELCVDGDRACRSGDRITLVAIAWDLVARAREPLHCELVRLADDCADPERATTAWSELKQRIQQASP